MSDINFFFCQYGKKFKSNGIRSLKNKGFSFELENVTNNQNSTISIMVSFKKVVCKLCQKTCKQLATFRSITF